MQSFLRLKCTTDTVHRETQCTDTQVHKRDKREDEKCTQWEKVDAQQWKERQELGRMNSIQWSKDKVNQSETHADGCFGET